MSTTIWLWWLLAVALVAGGAIVAFWNLHGRRVAHDGKRRCPSCRYDMTAIPGLRCPECGVSARTEKSLRRPKRRWWTAFAGVLALLSGVVAAVVPFTRGRGYAAAPTSVLIPLYRVAPTIPLGDALLDHVSRELLSDEQRRNLIELCATRLDNLAGLSPRRRAVVELYDYALLVQLRPKTWPEVLTVLRSADVWDKWKSASDMRDEIARLAKEDAEPLTEAVEIVMTNGNRDLPSELIELSPQHAAPVLLKVLNGTDGEAIFNVLSRMPGMTDDSLAPIYPRLMEFALGPDDRDSDHATTGALVQMGPGVTPLLLEALRRPVEEVAEVRKVSLIRCLERRRDASVETLTALRALHDDPTTTPKLQRRVARTINAIAAALARDDLKVPQPPECDYPP